jgi:Cdc6-like AAA superfamily ATPase
MITQEFKDKVCKAIIEDRTKYTSLSDAKYAKSIGISSAIFSRLKNGETTRLLSDGKCIEIGRKLNISNTKVKWNVARTTVSTEIEQLVNFCKEYKKATILVDECGIGKTFCTKHIIRNLQNSFYVDCSQAKTKSQFIRHLARTLGVDNTGRLYDVKENLKYYINLIENPFIALDDAGYLDTNVLVEIIEIWNATENNCGWLMIGDDSLQNKVERGLKSKKVGFKALFSRFSDEFIHYVPIGKQDKQEFFKQLIGDVASVNVVNKTSINKLIKLCLSKEKTLRHLSTLIQLDKAYE